jgi:integrase
MTTLFRSILKDELALFMDVLKLSISTAKTYNEYQKILTDFDSFLHAENLNAKKLDADMIKRWIDGFDVQPATKAKKMSPVRRFGKYLSTLGIEASFPEMPRISSDFTPYVFSKEEMRQIFEVADDLVMAHPNSRKVAEFPLLIRLLYGCGFRLGEATALTWNDVNLAEGVITVKAAKNQKQRLVPISEELARILKLYRTAPHFKMQGCELLFKTNEGRSRTVGAYWSVFDTILCELGIKNPQTVQHRSRGPCIHSLRHTFALHSLLKAEEEGRGFMEIVPFLSTYLGHSGLMETDKYFKARHELYTEAHSTIEDYTSQVFPIVEEVFPEED